MTTRSEFSGTDTDRACVVVVVERKPVSEEALKWALEAGEITTEMQAILVHVRPHVTTRPGRWGVPQSISDPPTEADQQYIKQVDTDCDKLLERFKDFCKAKNVLSRKVLMSSDRPGRCVVKQAEDERAVRVYLGRVGRGGGGKDIADYCVTNLSQYCTVVQFYSPTNVQRVPGQRSYGDPPDSSPPPTERTPGGSPAGGSYGDITVELLRLRGEVERLHTDLSTERRSGEQLKEELRTARNDADELRGLLSGTPGGTEVSMYRDRWSAEKKKLEGKKKELQDAEEESAKLLQVFDETLANEKAARAQEKQDLESRLLAAEALREELQQTLTDENAELQRSLDERRVRELADLQSTLFTEYERQKGEQAQTLREEFEAQRAALQQDVEMAQKDKEEQRTSFQALHVQVAADLEQKQAALQDLQRQLEAKHNHALRMEQEKDALSAELDTQRAQAQDATEQLEAALRREAGQARLLEQALAELDRMRRENVRFTEYTWEELNAATEQFSPARRVGEGGFGTVFRGRLHHTDVAIKCLNGESMQGQIEFERELDVLGRMRHPHLLILLGACPEHHTLVYEFMHGGSLEDRLRGAGQTRLLWYERIRILTEVGTGLLFLHSAKPRQVVHRDLKPANILLDARGISKIGDAGLAICMQDQFATVVTSNPVGTFPYMDPEFVSRGEYSARSDTYALGIIMLEMLTGVPPPACIRMVERALGERGGRPPQLDPHAGAWPEDSAIALARLGMECVEIQRKDRPDLESNVLLRLQELQVRAEAAAQRAARDSNTAPYVFVCPITQVIMEDPVIAYDGFCYERAAIEPWLRARGRSPMTNLPVNNLELIPNFPLRSAIRDWLSRHGEPNNA